MAYILRPDDSDSDFSDDDYVSYEVELPNSHEPIILTEREKKQEQKRQLYHFICSGEVENVVQTLQGGLDVNIVLDNSWTPLLIAVSSGNAELSEALLNLGADPNSFRDGCTALMLACNCPRETSPYTESLKIVKLLIEKGVNVKATNRKKMTALMFAADAGNLPVVKYILPLSDKDAQDNQKWNVLFWAVNGNSVDMVEFLLEEGFEYMVSDIRNNTPLDIAKNNGFTDIINLFPQETDHEILNIIDSNMLSYEEIFSKLNNNRQPDFFIEICNILCGLKSEKLIKHFADKNINLKQFLSMNNSELEDLGIKMPYQRYRILSGLYQFHKHPYHPKSLHIVPLNETYSNIDVGVQLLSAIKQITIMEAALEYIIKNCDVEDMSEKQRESLRKNVNIIRKNIRQYSRFTKKLIDKTKMWDRQRAPADLITKRSYGRKWPWRKIIFSVSIVSLVILCRLKK
ncbi:ankyrin repeat, SAM and basic leucine zipper domain-containing protein 1 [Diabrotica virgifera virgifera]|uniref:Ankyrin repeat, SAM and basic leucine zipper domain-containing protein 1 n=1 Tax=Diabrotica virgifera virgifera TaxID=50390 RepID=A0A6P7FQX4_DIAVI|nr:ankyrin repeat, SAM and basic leucine zipper domain-containing protein 1 [Diabrotica virgifera virgifera]